jgi:ArsR family transcriptional regulator, arsenate/arsenite/antimonite-responsive transcriptional repressor
MPLVPFNEADRSRFIADADSGKVQEYPDHIESSAPWFVSSDNGSATTGLTPSKERVVGGMTLPRILPLAGEPIEQADAERLARLFKALGDPSRLRLLSLIQSAADGEGCVGNLAGPLGLSQPTISHHLRILTEAGLLEREKRGVGVYYRLTPMANAAHRLPPGSG